MRSSTCRGCARRPPTRLICSTGNCTNTTRTSANIWRACRKFEIGIGPRISASRALPRHWRKTSRAGSRSATHRRELSTAGWFFGVAGQQPVTADQQQIAEHHTAIAQHENFRGRTMRPPPEHFRDAQAVALGEKQNFRIEAEGFDTLLFENNARRLAAENFKSALGMVKWKGGNRPHQF